MSDASSLDVNEAVALMHYLTLSREQMRKMRHVLASKGIYFPTCNELLEGRKRLRPAVTSVPRWEWSPGSLQRLGEYDD